MLHFVQYQEKTNLNLWLNHINRHMKKKSRHQRNIRIISEYCQFRSPKYKLIRNQIIHVLQESRLLSILMFSEKKNCSKESF